MPLLVTILDVNGFNPNGVPFVGNQVGAALDVVVAPILQQKLAAEGLDATVQAGTYDPPGATGYLPAALVGALVGLALGWILFD